MRNIIFILQARLSIIDLLLIGLDKPAPSLSHFLLGFDLKKQASIGGQGSIARLVNGATFIKLLDNDLIFAQFQEEKHECLLDNIQTNQDCAQVPLKDLLPKSLQRLMKEKTFLIMI